MEGLPALRPYQVNLGLALSCPTLPSRALAGALACFVLQAFYQGHILVFLGGPARLVKMFFWYFLALLALAAFGWSGRIAWLASCLPGLAWPRLALLGLSPARRGLWLASLGPRTPSPELVGVGS